MKHTTPAFIEIDNVTTGYGNTALLHNISLSIQRGEIIGLIGRNGSGKSTLIRTLGGLLQPISGDIQLDGNSLYQMKQRQRAKWVSLVLTQRIALQGITVRTLLEMAWYPHNQSAGIWLKREQEIEASIMHGLNQLKIEHLANKPLAQLSDGELQKAMIARCLVQRTPFIIMDEPTAFLDYIAKNELMQMLRQLVDQNNIAILFSSHDLELVQRFSTHCWMIEERAVKKIDQVPIVG